MFQLFGGAEKPAVRVKSSPADDDRIADVGAEDRDDAALRLERELAVLLARKPLHRTHIAGRDVDEDDGETPLVPVTGEEHASTHDGSTATRPDSGPEAHSAATGTPPADGATLQTETDTAQRWMKSTRKNRRSALFRKSASVAITFVVTAFIISIVAVILFGLPDGVKQFTAAGDRTALITTRKVGTVPVKANIAPARLQWVSK